MRVFGRTIVVTGAGSGIGRELAIGLRRKGARVIGADVHADALQATAALLSSDGGGFTGFVLDVSDKLAVERFRTEAIAVHGGVDGIINNAGIIQPFTRLAALDYEHIDRVMNVNFHGTLWMVKAFLPHLLGRPEGHIVNISSMGAFLPVPGQTVYGASKAAVKLLTEGLYAELSDTHVRVSVVFPGAVHTNIAENSGLTPFQPSGRGGRAMRELPAADAAEEIIKGMERDRYRIVVGRDARTMDILSRLHPRFANRLISRRLSGLLKP